MAEDLKIYVKPDVSLLLRNIGRFLVEEDIKAYLVGGFVRDMLLERDTGDIDIIVADNALKIAPKMAAAFGGKYIPLDEINEVGRVVLFNGETAPDKIEKKREIDFSTLKGGSIEHDLSQRDFTIDAMAIEVGKIIPELDKNKFILSPSLLIDPWGGRDDLYRGVLRAVSDTAFTADPARLLRAVRLTAELGFKIDTETESLIQRHCQLITSVAGERLREELLRLLALPQVGQFLAYLDNLGLLTTLMPEMFQTKGVDQPRVHFWDVFDHSIQTVVAADFVLRQGSWQYAGGELLDVVPWSVELSQHFDQEVSHGSDRRSLLKLAALLHDIAKPETKSVDEEGRARFLGHPGEGAVVAAGILERLRFSTREIKLVEIMVKYHLRPGQMSNDGLPSRRAIYRYFRDTGEAGIDILFLGLADHLATRGPNLDLAEWQEHAQMVEYVITRHLEEENLTAPLKLIDGHDLINIFGLTPGPKIGEFLEVVHEAQADGEVTNRQEAIDYVSDLLGHQVN